MLSIPHIALTAALLFAVVAEPTASRSAGLEVDVALVLAGDASASMTLPVDLALVLAVDVSSSIDRVEQRVEREGYVDAFRDPEILRAIRSGPLGRIAVIYFEWAGSLHQSVAVPWTIIESGADAEAFASSLAGQPILPEAGTSISASLAFAARLFPVSGTRPLRRAIDISGDGVNNDGPPVAFPRNALIAEGVTINGLPIELGGRSDISDYYKRSVIGGPGSFALTVERSADVVNAIRHKLILEIAWRPTSLFDAASAGAKAPAKRTQGQGNNRVRRSPKVSVSGQKRTSGARPIFRELPDHRAKADYRLLRTAKKSRHVVYCDHAAHFLWSVQF